MKLSEIAQRLGVPFDASRDADIFRVSDLRLSQSGDIAFLNKSSYRDALAQCQASAVLLRAEDAPFCPVTALVVSDPYLAYAKVAQWLDHTPQQPVGVHASAVLGENVVVGKNVAIGAFVTIESGARIGDNVQIGSGCVIGHDSVIGDDTRLWPNVSIYHGVTLGARCIVHSASVIGADGFGFAQENKQWVKIPQLGGVVIGDDVEIGAHCAIDRGALNNTVIGCGVKLDNYIHIAHNVEIGDFSAIAAMSGVAGGTKIGKHVTLAGRVSVIGHLTICDRAHVTACTTVVQSITEPGVYSSGTTAQPNREWRKSLARFFQLDDVVKRIRAIEKQLGKHEEQEHE